MGADSGLNCRYLNFPTNKGDQSDNSCDYNGRRQDTGGKDSSHSVTGISDRCSNGNYFFALYITFRSTDVVFILYSFDAPTCVFTTAGLILDAEKVN